MKIKVSHEVPLAVLNASQAFNDYDYCLPHLLDSEYEYFKYFDQAKKDGRYIIMDNSLHELGHAYETERLLHWVNYFEPNEFIVPDVWEDYTASVVNARQWSKVKLLKGVEKVAVVQAKDLHEATLCTRTYKDLGYKKIAYSYGASYYNDLCPHPDKDFGKAVGRFMAISSLYKNKLLSDFDRVHLLGTASPIEFGMYSNFKFIESIDTSNPVMAGIEKRVYHQLGISPKPVANMNKYQDVSEDFIETELIEYNIRKFREINNL